ncbi:MAG: squalene/phytoene synthase family protein, partial [Acetobacteraceae bacterium]
MTGAVTVEAWSGKDRADENFPVGSALIRRDLRPHVHAFYAFARNADDIADSPVLTAEDKLARLDRMEAVLLGRTETAAPSEALREMSREVPRDIPREVPGEAPSARRLRASLAATGTTPTHATELLIAFRRDATRHRCADWDELLAYCRYSAMPVGRHVLDLHGEDRATWASSDALCTTLQVLNHLQ